MDDLWLVFSTVIGFGISIAGLYELGRGLASRHWVSTAGEVLSSRIEESSGYEGDTVFRPVIEYRYQVDGQHYEGDRLCFGSESVSAVERYSPGSTVAVYYDPVRPGNAVLEPGPRWDNLLLIVIGGVFTVFGLTSLFGG